MLHGNFTWGKMYRKFCLWSFYLEFQQTKWTFGLGMLGWEFEIGKYRLGILTLALWIPCLKNLHWQWYLYPQSSILDSCLSILVSWFLKNDSPLSILDPRLSILMSWFLILDTRSSILDSWYSILNTWFSILVSWSLILNHQFSILHSCFSFLDSLFLFTNTRSSILPAWFSITSILNYGFSALDPRFSILMSRFSYISSILDPRFSIFENSTIAILNSQSWILDPQSSILAEYCQKKSNGSASKAYVCGNLTQTS